MQSNYWKGLANLLNIFGILTLIMEFVVFSEFANFKDSQYWSLGAAVIWLLFVFSMACVVIAADLQRLPVPKRK